MPDVTLGQDETRQKRLKDLHGSLGGSRDSLRTLQAVPTPFLEPWFRETVYRVFAELQQGSWQWLTSILIDKLKVTENGRRRAE